MKKLPLLTALIAFTGQISYSQCTMIEVPLSEKIRASQTIFEGAVVSQNSFWNADHTNIFTANIIDVFKVFKGDIISGKVEIVTEGGKVNDEMEIVDPSLNLNVGEIGMFFAQPSSVINSLSGIAGNLKFEPSASVQSFVKYDLIDRVGTTAFKKYTDINSQLYGAIQIQTGQNYKEFKSFDINRQRSAAKNAMAPVITGFSPTTITGGTLSELTINGSGFGASVGSGKVEFKNVDDGGASLLTANPGNITSWTDTQIKILVPAKGGTGTIRVTDATGSSAVNSTGTLTVTYGQMTTIDAGKETRINFSNQNTTGGYSFQYASNFVSNTAAVASFERALKTWRCATLSNYKMASTTTSITCQAKDGVNMVSFDNNCILGGSLLGKTFTFYTACSKNSVYYWILAEMDIEFAGAAAGGSWNYGPGATSGTKTYDFESTALHELGHAQLEAHCINVPKLMHWSRAAATDVRTLDPNIDIACVNDNLSRSIVSNPCGATAHIKISSATCSVIGIDEAVANNPNVSVYPNPFVNSATLHLESSFFRAAGTISFALFDVLGNQIEAPVIVNSENFEIFREGLSDGVYFYRLKNAENIFATGKLILSGNN